MLVIMNWNRNEAMNKAISAFYDAKVVSRKAFGGLSKCISPMN